MRSFDDMEEKEIRDMMDAHSKAYIDLLSDVLKDRKRDTNFLKGIVVGLIVLVCIIAAGSVYINVRCQDKILEQAEKSEQRMYEFLSQYDFSGDVELDTGTILNSESSGNINVTR